MLVLAERLKKKDSPKQLYKPTTENIYFFNGEQIFVVKKGAKTADGQFMYWVSKEDGNKIIDKRFLRQELFALKSEFI